MFGRKKQKQQQPHGRPALCSTEFGPQEVMVLAAITLEGEDHISYFSVRDWNGRVGYVEESSIRFFQAEPVEGDSVINEHWLPVDE